MNRDAGASVPARAVTRRLPPDGLLEGRAGDVQHRGCRCVGRTTSTAHTTSRLGNSMPRDGPTRVCISAWVDDRAEQSNRPVVGRLDGRVVAVPDLDRLLTKAEAAEALAVSVRFIERCVFERRIRYVKVGKFVRIPASAVADFISAGEVPARW